MEVKVLLPTPSLHTPHRGKCGERVGIEDSPGRGVCVCVCVLAMCVVSQINHAPSEVIPHYMFMLSLGFTLDNLHL